MVIGTAVRNEPKADTFEGRVLSALRLLSRDDGPGWCRSTDGPLTELGPLQVASALERLKRKGLVYTKEWHPGQGNAYIEYVWFAD